MSTNTDRIQQKVLLRAPLMRVWQAIADSTQFGSWFGVQFDGPFVAGTTLSGRIVPTAVDAEVAASQKPYEGMVFQFLVDRIEPMLCFPSAGIRTPSILRWTTRKSPPLSSCSSWKRSPAARC